MSEGFPDPNQLQALSGQPDQQPVAAATTSLPAAVVAPLPGINEELERLQSLGFERIGSSNLVAGGGMLIEKTPDAQRFYVPFSGLEPEGVTAIRLSNTFGGRDTNEFCLQIARQLAPEIAERRGEGVEYKELVAGGSQDSLGDRREAEIQARAALDELGQEDLETQLASSGFERELSEEGNTVMRYSGAQGQLVAVIKDGRLKDIFLPIDQTGRSDPEFDPQQFEIIGTVELPDFGNVRPGLRLSYGWAEFALDPKRPIGPRQPRIVREPSLEELNITPLEEVAEPSGFVQGGVNDTELIHGLTSINSVPIAQLEADMRPSTMSQAGFLGPDESLTELLAQDNDTVRSLGLTHQDLALPLRYVQEIYRRRMITSSFTEATEITIGGHPYAVSIRQSHGAQESPFKDGTAGSYDLTVKNLESGHTISASSLLSDMIARYGFYEGRGTPYRTAPEDIIRTFSHLTERATKQD